jgi:hypothetical protein
MVMLLNQTAIQKRALTSLWPLCSKSASEALAVESFIVDSYGSIRDESMYSDIDQAPDHDRTNLYSSIKLIGE